MSPFPRQSPLTSRGTLYAAHLLDIMGRCRLMPNTASMQGGKERPGGSSENPPNLRDITQRGARDVGKGKRAERPDGTVGFQHRGAPSRLTVKEETAASLPPH